MLRRSSISDLLSLEDAVSFLVVLPAKPAHLHRPLVIVVMRVCPFIAAYFARHTMKQTALERRGGRHVRPPLHRVFRTPLELMRELDRGRFGHGRPPNPLRWATTRAVLMLIRKRLATLLAAYSVDEMSNDRVGEFW
jgi:hypothetical protein